MSKEILRPQNKPLAQSAEHKPVAWMDRDGNVSDNNDHKCFPIPLYTTPNIQSYSEKDNSQPEQKPMHPELRKMWEDYFDKCFRAQPEQEPVAIALNTGTKQGVKWLKNVEHGLNLYTTPPQRPWVGLTNEDMGFLFPHGKSEWVQETVKIIEAKLRSKNNAT